MAYMKKLMAGLLAISMLGAVGCSAKKENGQTSKENLTLKVGVMPAVDSAPIFLAEKKGYFKDLGLDIEVQLYTNAMNRQSALQSGELDGAMTDVIALVNNIENGFDIKVTTSTDGSFPILVKKDLEEKKDLKIGMMEVSVSNYLSDEWLGADYNLDKIYINDINARLEMLKTGEMDMAVLPEPIATKGQAEGLEKRVYEIKDEYSPDVMVFTGKAIKDKEKALQLFHEAYNKAVEEIQKDDGEARDILIEKLQLDAKAKEKIAMPKFNKARVPSKEYLEKIMEWNERVLKKKVNLKYEDMVEGKFVK